MINAYFYMHGSDSIHDEVQELLVTLESKADAVYIEEEGEQTVFEGMLQKMQKGDTVFIVSFFCMASDHHQLKDRLMVLEEREIQLILRDFGILPLRILLEFQECCEESRKEELKKKQHKGIAEALERKKRQEGNYGRPQIKMPENFEEKIKEIMYYKNRTHTAYRRQLGLSKATYYKLIKEVKEHWKEQELSGYTNEEC